MLTNTRRRFIRDAGAGLAASAGIFGLAGPGRAAPPSTEPETPPQRRGADEPDDMRWAGTWATTPDALDGLALDGQTLRMIARVSIGGGRLQVRISNAYGARSLVVGSASVGTRSRGADTVSGSDRALTFGGSRSFAIPAGALAVSDPVELEMSPLTDLAVSLYLPDDMRPGFRPTGHDNAHQVNFISPPGDFTSAAAFPIQRTIDGFAFVTGVDVLAPRTVGSVVAFGDSLTEGNLSTADTNSRWPDQLARRLAARKDSRFLGVVNQGIGGNRLLHDARGDSGLRRFDRDVLAQPGVTHAIICIGINDLRNSGGAADQVVSEEQMIGGLHQIALRGHAAGIKVIGGTLLPWENDTFKGGFYTPEAERKRQAVNAWIRGSRDLDAVIDFDAMMRDPDHPARLMARWDSGDHLHPNDAGYLHMGDRIDLALFD